MIEPMLAISDRITDDSTSHDCIESEHGHSDESIWLLHHELRSSLNALGLCVRVLEGGPPDREAREYARFISEATEKIQRLIGQLRPTRLI